MNLVTGSLRFQGFESFVGECFFHVPSFRWPLKITYFRRSQRNNRLRTPWIGKVIPDAICGIAYDDRGVVQTERSGRRTHVVAICRPCIFRSHAIA